jgi:hypothetical protein
MNRVENLCVKVGGTKCFMMFMVLAIDGFGLSHENWACSGCWERSYPNQKWSWARCPSITSKYHFNVVYSLKSGDEFETTIMPMFIMCEKNESKIEEKINVGSDDWEGCDWFGLLSLHESVRTGEWQ